MDIFQPKRISHKITKKIFEEKEIYNDYLKFTKDIKHNYFILIEEIKLKCLIDFHEYVNTVNISISKTHKLIIQSKNSEIISKIYYCLQVFSHLFLKRYSINKYKRKIEIYPLGFYIAKKYLPEFIEMENQKKEKKIQKKIKELEDLSGKKVVIF